jgi:hypothetical protein
MNKRIYLIALLLIATGYLTNAQTWQWGKRGGSADAGSGGPDETVVGMATDPKGNIYVLSYVLQTSLNIDGHAKTGWGYQDILISSFNCDGTYRWSKDIGTNSSDVPIAIKTDTLGGVYITGALVGGSVTRHLDADSSWPSGSYQSMFLMKYDTAGNYKWFRYPQPDTITSYGEFLNPDTGPIDMDVDGGGNIYMLCNLEPGGYANNSYVVATEGYHMLKYDKNGNFVNGNPMQITYTSAYSNLLMKKDFKNGRYYITGTLSSGTLSFAGTPITHALFVGCFNNAGSLLWQKQNTENYSGWFGRPIIDAAENIYLAGTTATSDTFNGYAVVNGGSTAVPIVVKLDTNGHNIWATNAMVNAATVSNVITLIGDDIDIAGRYPGKLKWPGYTDSLNLATGSDYHIFITRLNGITGAVKGMDSLVSTSGTFNEITAIAADKFGNFYVGGDFASSITVAGTTLNSIGGGSDFFIAKYGSGNCLEPITLETAPEPGRLTITDIHVFPNPATDELNITGVPSGTSYRLLSITGSTLMQGQLQEGSNSLPMQRMASCIYLLEMTGADGARNIVRVVKE